MQMNTAKWPFSIDEDALHVIVDVALPRFLDSAAVHMHAYARHMQCMCPHATCTEAFGRYGARYTWTHGYRQSTCVLRFAAPCRAHTLRALCLASAEQG